MGGPALLQADLLSPQDPVPPTGEKPLLGAPQSAALVSRLRPEGMSVSPMG